MKNRKKNKSSKNNITVDLADSQFGLPASRKYPIDTVDHVKLVVKFFNKVDEKDKKELARNIFRVMDELNIDKKDLFGNSEFDRFLTNKIHLEDERDKDYKSFVIMNEKNVLEARRVLDYDSFFSRMDIAIEEYLKENFRYIDVYSKITRDVYVRNRERDIICIGQIEIFAYEDISKFEWDWLPIKEESKKEEVVSKPKTANNPSRKNVNKDIRKTNTHIINEYKNKIIKLYEENNKSTILVSRLSFDNFDNLFMRFTEKDKKYLNNKLRLSDVLDEDTYVIADVHFGKTSVNEDEKLIRMINQRAKKHDVLIFLGDIGYMKNVSSLQQRYLKDCIREINCENKVLILGNHDIFSLKFYYDCGIKSIYERFFDVKRGIILSHQPCNSKYEDDYNFHGHLHSSSKYHETIKNTDKKINCYARLHDKILTIGEYLNEKKKQTV